jgi:hypothetical protein
MRSLDQQLRDATERLKDNQEKIKMNKQLPYLVGNVVEVSRGTRPARRVAFRANAHPC